MADTAFTVKVDGVPYTVGKFTLGDWRIFKTHFGLNSSDILTSLPPNADGEVLQTLNIEDPNVLIGLLVVALHHARPLESVQSLIAEVEALGMDGFEFPDAEVEEEEADPTEVVEDAAEATDKPSAKSGSSVKRQKKPGSRS